MWFCQSVLLWFATFKITAIRKHRLCKIKVETGLSIKWPHVEPEAVNSLPTRNW